MVNINNIYLITKGSKLEGNNILNAAKKLGTSDCFSEIFSEV